MGSGVLVTLVCVLSKLNELVVVVRGVTNQLLHISE